MRLTPSSCGQFVPARDLQGHRLLHYTTAPCLIALRDTDLRSDLKKIKIPTLIMHGRKDKICSFDLAEQMKVNILNSQLVVFVNSGHSLFLEETQKFNAEIIKFAE